MDAREIHEGAFMDSETAKKVIDTLNQAIAALNEGIRLVTSRGSEDEARAFRRGVGHTMTEIHERLADPIFREHPDLVPDEAEYAPGSGPTLGEIGARSTRGRSP